MADPLRRTVIYGSFLIYLPSFFLHLGIGIIEPILPLYARSFGVSYALTALVITFYALGRLMTSMPVGFLIDRFGRKPFLFAGPLCIMFSAIMCALAGSYWELVVYRFIGGSGMSMWLVAQQTTLVDILRPEERGRIITYFHGVLLAGTALGPAIGGLIAVTWGLRSVFYSYALVALICLILSLVFIKETKKVTEESQTSGRKVPYRRTLRKMLANRGFAAACIAILYLFFTRSGIRATIIPLYAQNSIGLNEGQIGVIMSLFFLMSLALVFPTGFLLDRYGRKIILVSSLCVMSLACFLFSYTYNFFTLAFVTLVLGAGTGFGRPIPMVLAADASAAETRGLAMGVLRIFSDLGYGIGSIVLGLVADGFGLNTSFYFAALFALTIAILTQIFAEETLKRNG